MFRSLGERALVLVPIFSNTTMNRIPVTRRLALAFSALALTSPALVAQSAPAATATDQENQPFKLEAFTVTGSNIKRIEQEKTLPIVVIDANRLEARDASQASDLLASMPQATGLPLNETATLGATARGDNASLSLRGIPSGNTLILINGRRTVAHPISANEANVPALSPNVNQLPNRGIERIEVLTDGASSIYGTDAVAGVVNYIMKKPAKGTEVSFRYAVTGEGDGKEMRFSVTDGRTFANGKGRVSFTADYYDRDAIWARDRSFSADADHSSMAPAPWNVSTSTVFNARSATSAFGNYLTGTIAGTDSFGSVNAFTAARPAGVPTTLTTAGGQFFLVPLGGGAVGFQTTTPVRSGVTNDYYWNNNTYRVIQPQSTRQSLFASADYRLTDKIDLFSELTIYSAKSDTVREMDGITQSTDGFIIVPATNPYNPFGTRFWSPTGAPNADGTARLTGTPAAVSITNKRLVDLSLRAATVDTTVWRGLVGARGSWGQTWNWETGLLMAEAKTTDRENGATRKSKLIAAINQTDPALAYNPFGYSFAVQNGTLAVTGPFRSPESVTSTFREAFIREGKTKLASADFRAGGDVVNLWGGNTVGVAFGGEYRKEDYSDKRPAFAGLNPAGSGLDPLSNDYLGFSPNPDTIGDRNVSAAYIETLIPLVGRDFTLPLVKSFEISASGRYERYSDFGDIRRPKLGANWSPFSWMKVRASYNEGYRAPNLALLFSGSLIRTATGVTDTYRSAVTGLPTDGPSNRRTVSSGNLSLRPETSKGKSAGIAVEVPFIKRLTLTADYWEISQSDVIANPTSGENIANDFAALNAATQAALASGTAIGNIDLGSGTSNYRGDSAIVRVAVTQADRDAFAAYNATRPAGQQRAVVGAIDIIRSTYFNRSSQFVNGIDLGANYVVPKFFGQWTFDTQWTQLFSFYGYNGAGTARQEFLNSNATAVGGASPRWRGTASIAWRLKDWSATVGGFYTGSYTDSGATTNQATYDSLGQPTYLSPFFTNGLTQYRYVVRDSVYYNASVTYRIRSSNKWLDRSSIRVGVVNLTDKEPPLSSDSRGYDPAVYNNLARGRSFSLELRKSF
jgi:outer membrane receptor protein involved in Fe transport